MGHGPRIDFVLVRPTRAGNVAAACRALKNMGFSSLRVVGECPGLGSADARNLAYGAWDVLDGIASFPTLKSATEDAHLVVGTTGRTDVQGVAARDLGAQLLARGARRVSVVFGPEASGLRGDELDLCHVAVHVPTALEHSSLNLAQAVLVVAYELRLALLVAGPSTSEPDLATAGEVEAALDLLREGLLAVGYLNPAAPDHILAELRRLFVRARLTQREATLLRGIGRQLVWAGGVHSKARGSED